MLQKTLNDLKSPVVWAVLLLVAWTLSRGQDTPKAPEPEPELPEISMYDAYLEAKHQKQQTRVQARTVARKFLKSGLEQIGETRRETHNETVNRLQRETLDAWLDVKRQKWEQERAEEAQAKKRQKLVRKAMAAQKDLEAIRGYE